MTLRAIIEAQRGTLLLWMPLALALGIGGYFGLPWEPEFSHYFLALVATAVPALGLLFWRREMSATSIFIALIAIGFIAAGHAANRKSEPVLSFRYFGPVEGRIIAIDRSSGDAARITLDQVVLERVSPHRTPALVRISLLFPTPFVTPMPGQRVILTASLSPPEGPVEPGGFDFQRFAWFLRLGAVGYARTPMLEVAAPDTAGWRMKVFALRTQFANGIRARLPGQKGAFLAAILTGDRSGVDPDVLKSLRASNLAHLLAISGLHMGLLTGFVFAAIRYGLALLPRIGLRLPAKKIAAICAFCAAIAYLVLSGSNVATQRAFIMVAVMLLAVLLDRRALTLRSVALAAVIVLMLRPESLIEAGFQMSFAATTALVSVFAVLSDTQVLQPSAKWMSRYGRGAVTLFISSAVAGAATAPVSAFHFNQIAQYGLLANLASVPIMGSVIMPCAVVAILLAPVGLDMPAWTIAGWGMDWILMVSDWVGNLSHSQRQIVKPDNMVLPIFAFGAYILVALRGRIRLCGLAPACLALALWGTTDRPTLLVSANGRVIGLATKEGRVVNQDRGNSFIVKSWLENDGDAAQQADAVLRKGLVSREKGSEFTLVGTKVAYLWDKSLTTPDLTFLCQRNKLVIVPQVALAAPVGCTVIDKTALRELGSIAVTEGADGLRLTGARKVTGTRLWSR